MKITTTIFGVIALVLAAGQVNAQPPGKGPQASVLSATTCALDFREDDLTNTPYENDAGAFLLVTTTLTDKSSGMTIAALRGGKISSITKDKSARGKNASQVWEDNYIVDLFLTPDLDDPNDPPQLISTLPEPIPDPGGLAIPAEFALCNTDGTVRQRVDQARELNGASMVKYGMLYGDEPDKTVENRCTDPDPYDDINQGGIKVADVIADIEYYCSLVAIPPPMPIVEPVTTEVIVTESTPDTTTP